MKKVEAEKIEKKAVEEREELSRVLYRHEEKINGLLKTWHRWFSYTYPPHTGQLIATRKLVYNTVVHGTKWNNPLLGALYIRDNMNISKYSLKAQIDCLIDFLSDISSEYVPEFAHLESLKIKYRNISTLKSELYYCATELDRRGIKVTKFIREAISKYEPELLKKESNPVVDMTDIGARESLVSADIDPDEYMKEHNIVSMCNPLRTGILLIPFVR